MNKCLFLDRDGVINKDIGYAYKAEQIQFVDGIFSLCRHYQRLGYRIIIVTNQSGIAREYYTEKQFQQLSEWMTDQFRQRFIRIDGIYHCPHHPKITGSCACRKPQPGMFLKAKSRFNLDMTQSIMIGDKESDMIAAKQAEVSTRVLFQEGSKASIKGRNNSVATTHCHQLKQLIHKRF